MRNESVADVRPRGRRASVLPLVRRVERVARRVHHALERRNWRWLSPWLQVARNREFWRFVRFLATGGVNFAFSYSVFLLTHLLGATPTGSVVASWVLGVLFNFATTGRVVFGTGKLTLLPRFIAVYVVQLAANIVMIRTLIVAGLSVPLAQAIVVALLAVATFFALRRLVFRGSPFASSAG